MAHCCWRACLLQQQDCFATLQTETPTDNLCVAAQSVRRFEYWRWGFYFACWFPICWLTSLAIKLLVKLVESQLLAANRNILYYTASVKASHTCSSLHPDKATQATNMGMPLLYQQQHCAEQATLVCYL